ncbi:hypothetical protein BaRGS_00017504, partial [Batillaria attramentaria]
MNSKTDYRCRPALATLLHMATRQAMQTSHVRDPPLMPLPVFQHEPRLRVEPEEESFFSSEGDVSLLPADADVDNSQPLLFKDMIRKAAYTQCSERQVLMGKVFEQVHVFCINGQHIHSLK